MMMVLSCYFHIAVIFVMLFERIPFYTVELEEAEQRIAESNKMIVSLKNELSQAHQELQKHSQEINSLELRLQDTEEHTRAAVEEAVAELRERLSPQVGFDSQDNDSETSSIQTLVEEDMIMVKEQERQLSAAPGGGILSSKESSSSATSLNTSGDSDGRLQNHVQVETGKSDSTVVAVSSVIIKPFWVLVVKATS